MDNKAYEILSGDIVCAIFKNEQLDVINERFAPLYLCDFRSWVESRAISEKRGYTARLLKETSDISPAAGAYETALKNSCACVTDNYWVREIGEKKKYEDVNYDTYDGVYAKLALGVDTDLRNYRSKGRNPELTNIGNSDKAWIKDSDGIRWLYKRQPLLECYNEILASKIAKKLSIETVSYELVSKTEPDPLRGQWGIVRSQDFTQGENVNLEHADLILKHFNVQEKEIEENADIFNEFGLVNEYMDIVYLDIITGNGDRHARNYGVLRDRDSGEVIKFAPNYDNNFAFTRDLSMAAFVKAVTKYDYVPNVLTDEDIESIKKEMHDLGCDSDMQLSQVKWKQKSMEQYINDIDTGVKRKNQKKRTEIKL